jgi:hypothetical protein
VCACAVAALHSMPLQKRGSQGITPSHHQQQSRATTQGGESPTGVHGGQPGQLGSDTGE